MANPETELHLEQPRSVLGTWAGVVLLFAVFAIFVWAVLLAMPRGDSYELKRAEARREKLKVASEEAQTTLTHYGWVDKEKGVVHVPVRRAMELTMAELAQRKPAPAGPIPPDPAQPGLQATAPVTPAAGAAPPAPTPAAGQTVREGVGSSSAGQPAAAANPQDAPAGTQPGPDNTPPPPPSSTTREFQQGGGEPAPVQSPSGTPIPPEGKAP
ncbi:MAG: hypothetical protein ABI883_01815 [Chthoniobacterales bacterium]